MSRYPERYEGRTGRRYGPGIPRTLDARAPTNLANNLNPRVKVSCVLAPEGITWNRYKDETVIVMYLQFRAVEPPGYKLRDFELDILFAPAPHSFLPGIDPSDITAENQDLPSPTVWLLQSPSPNPLPEYIEGRPWSETQSRGFTVEPSGQAGAGGGSIGSFSRTTEKSIFYKWQFRSYPVSDEHNYLTTAKWIWESNKNNPQVEDRGTLHGAVALQSAGTDLLLQCKVEGRLCKGPWWRRFRTGKAEPALWWAKLGTPTPNFEEHVKNLEAKMKEMNMVAPVRVQEPI